MSHREPQSVSCASQPHPEKVIVSGRRLDGRGYEEFREALMNAGTLSQAAGSSYAELGNTKVMVGVYGPRESDRRDANLGRGRLLCDIKRISFATITRSKSKQTDADKESANVLQTALEAAVDLRAFPKSSIHIYCVVMESGGSDMPLLITAASLALADAGIPMFDLVSACSVSRIGEELLLDPTHDEVFRENGSCLLALMPTQNKVTHLILTGEWSAAQLSTVLELGLGGCQQMDAAVRDVLKEPLMQ